MRQKDLPAWSVDNPEWTMTQCITAWVVTLTGALFFFYEFIQMNMFNSLSRPLEQTFHLGALELGIVAAFYFISDTLLVYPAGVLCDWFSSKKLLITGMVMCIVGTWLITLADDAWFLIVARFLAGTASAFCLLSVLRLAAQWFPPSKMGQITGVVIAFGMLGGAVSQPPLVWLIGHYGWREALHITALLGVVILIAIVFVVRDAPKQKCFAALQTDQDQQRLSWWQGFVGMVSRKNNWLSALYISTMNLPIMLLAGLFGTQVLHQAEGVSVLQGSTASMMIFIGTIAGSPFFGYLSDRVGSRRWPMLIAAILALLLFMFFVYVPHLSALTYNVLFFVLGFITAAQIIGYPVARESNPANVIGTALGFLSVFIFLMPALLQPLIGWILSASQGVKMIAGVHWYAYVAYQHAMWVLVVGFVVSIVSAWALSETFGQG